MAIDSEGAMRRMPDPTYVSAEIDANPVWALAHQMSEIDNDDAPIGWSKYVPMAMWLRQNFAPDILAAMDGSTLISAGRLGLKHAAEDALAAGEPPSPPQANDKACSNQRKD